LTQSGDQYMGRGLVNPDNNNLAPRLGLSYSPTNRWTVRAGGGVFFVQDIGNPTFDLSRNLAGRDLYIPSIEGRTASMSDPWAEEGGRASCTGWSGPCLVAPQYLAVVQDNRTPYVIQWLFNIQREITPNLVVEAGYQGNEGHKLLRFVFYNQPIVKSGPSDTRTVAQRQPWPAYGPVMDETGADNPNWTNPLRGIRVARPFRCLPKGTPAPSIQISFAKAWSCCLQHIPSRKGESHDIPSATNDRRHAGAKSRPEHANLLRTTGIPV